MRNGVFNFLAQDRVHFGIAAAEGISAEAAQRGAQRHLRGHQPLAEPQHHARSRTRCSRCSTRWWACSTNASSTRRATPSSR